MAACLSTHWDEKIYDQIDDSDDLSARPGFAALVYPAYLERKKLSQLRKEVDINPRATPTYIAHTKDDHSYIGGSMLYNTVLAKANVKVKFQLYEEGGYGFGIRSAPELEASKWPREFEEWLSSPN